MIVCLQYATRYSMLYTWHIQPQATGELNSIIIIFIIIIIIIVYYYCLLL